MDNFGSEILMEYRISPRILALLGLFCGCDPFIMLTRARTLFSNVFHYPTVDGHAPCVLGAARVAVNVMTSGSNSSCIVSSKVISTDPLLLTCCACSPSRTPKPIKSSLISVSKVLVLSDTERHVPISPTFPQTPSSESRLRFSLS